VAYEIITDLLLVLALAVLTGEVFEQVGLPSVAGELLSGLLLGPTFLGIVVPGPETDAVSSVALFFVVFLIGFEMTTETVRKHIFPSILISWTSFDTPLVITIAAALLLLPFGAVPNVVVALAIAVPSISIISVLVAEKDLLDQKTGQLILSSVTVTDIAAFVLLAAVSETLSSTFFVVAYTAVFLIAFALLDWALNARPKALRRFLGRASRITKREELYFALLIVGGLLVAAVLQDIGVSYILGAFFAGLIVHDGLIGKDAFRKTAETLSRMNRGFFIPVFFGLAGIEANFPSSDLHLLAPLALLLVCSVVPAVVLTYWAAQRILRSEPGGARQVAFILGGRGAVGIVVASAALRAGIVNSDAYSLVVVATIAVSLVVPVLAGRKDRISRN
jgi:Kef-type K+ transport system membrane component KefB